MADLLPSEVMMTRSTGSVKDRKTSIEANAIMAIAIASAVSDGKLEEFELQQLRLLAELNPMYREVANIDDFIASILQEIGGLSLDKVIASSADVLSPKLKETAYAWAVEIAYVDGKEEGSNGTFLHHLRRHLDIDRNLGRTIFTVRGIRNRSA